jgi:hypothetical protein
LPQSGLRNGRYFSKAYHGTGREPIPKRCLHLLEGAKAVKQEAQIIE